MTAVPAEVDDLGALRREVDRLADEAATLTAELKARNDELAVFKARYLTLVAPLVARYEWLTALVTQAAGAPADATFERAASSKDAARQPPPVAADRPEVDPDTLRDNYRRMARRAHPDLATDEADRQRRTALMSRINDARDGGDIAALSQLEAELETLGDLADSSLGGRRERLSRARDRLVSRCGELQRELDTLSGSAMRSLHLRADAAAAEGRDLLAEMASELDEKIAALDAELTRSGGSRQRGS